MVNEYNGKTQPSMVQNESFHEWYAKLWEERVAITVGIEETWKLHLIFQSL